MRFGKGPPCLFCSETSCQTVRMLDLYKIKTVLERHNACQHGLPSSFYIEEHFCHKHKLYPSNLKCKGEAILRDEC